MNFVKNPLLKNCTHEDVKPIGEDEKKDFEFMSSFYIGLELDLPQLFREFVVPFVSAGLALLHTSNFLIASRTNFMSWWPLR